MKDKFVISSGELSAAVLMPESPDYARTRFDHSAFVPDVVYKGVHFGRPEQLDPAKPSTNGAGLCCELICPDAELAVNVGEEFVKPGVGYIVRGEKPWFFADRVPYRPLETTVTVQDDRALFVTESDMLGGIAYRECRMLRAEDNRLTLSIHFENQGEKPLDMLEFCHNFVSLGDLPVDERYHLALPCVRTIAPDEKSHLTAEKGGVTWDKAPEATFFNVFEDVQPVDGYVWRLYHDESKAAISETVDFAPVRLTVWGLNHVVSAEAFHHIALQPGESADWTRVWTFEA